MDVNGVKFWMLSTHDDLLPPGGLQEVSYCAQTSRLMLRSARTGPAIVEDAAKAAAMVEIAPMTADGFGNYARWDSATGHVMAGGSAPGEVPIYTPPAMTPVTDLALGYDGVLYIAVGGTLVLVDRRNRWPNFTLTDASCNFWRLLPLPGGGVLALDRANGQIVVVTGQPPIANLPLAQPDPNLLRTCGQNDSPRIAVRIALPAGAATETWIAVSATSDPSRFALLSWSGTAQAWLRLIALDAETLKIASAPNELQMQAAAGLAAPVLLSGITRPHSLAALDAMQFALLVSGTNEALIYDLSEFAVETKPIAGTASAPSGDSYILAAVNDGPFGHTFDLPPKYTHGTALLPLLPLSLNAFSPSGTAANQRAIDSGTRQSTWHRLYLEAVIPPRCGVTVWLAASDDPTALTGPNVAWFPHVAGMVDLTTLPPETPRAVWLPTVCEAAFAKPLLEDPPVKNRSGLFMTLVQRAGVAVRSLRGRYLAVRVEMHGDRRSTPQIAALRVYASRFSYVDNYLPQLYRENTFGPDADSRGPSTQPDFLERFVDIFEGQLTRIEDRVASSYLLTRADSAPDDGLDWLGGWIGVRPGNYPPGRRRARLAATPRLYRERGTVKGITRALDVATNGLCTRGAVIVIEDFRLRHTFATILGANLSISDDPLLPGYSASSNSFVGDTLFLGDPHNKEFLSLYESDLLTLAEQQQVQAYEDTLANRITIFVHDQVETVDLGLIGTIVEQEKPAHVASSIRRATQGFMIGIASLVGVNTFLTPAKKPGVVTVGASEIGRHDLLTHLPSLDPRIENDPRAGAV
jgi:phage tail-like protein